MFKRVLLSAVAAAAVSTTAFADYSANTVPGEGQIRNRRFVRFEGKGMRGGLLVVGSSYAWHGPNVEKLDWHGDWGMAASSREKDVAHLLWTELKKKNSDAPMCIAQSGNWERNYTGDVQVLERDFTELKNFRPDWICIVTTAGNSPLALAKKYPVTEYYIRMVEWFHRLNPSAKVVISTTRRIPGLRDGLVKWATKQGIPVVDHDFLDEKGSGYRAYGQFKHSGVAWHPSDAGFAEMARRYAVAFGSKSQALPTFVAGDPQGDVVVRPDGEVTSLEAALARVRELRAAGKIPADRAAEVFVAPGRYHVSRTVMLTPEDSNVNFTGCDCERTVIDGGVEIGPFSAAPDGLWVADVPTDFSFEQLWVGGRRATRARTPNEGLFLYMREPDDRQPIDAFFARTEDVAPLAALSADELQRVQVVYWQSWDMGYTPIRSLDAKSGHIQTARKGYRGFFFWDKTCPRYILENYRAALDAPGEWFLDESVHKLLYMPRPGERLGETKAYAPKVETILHLKGDAAKGAYVRNVRFRGIGFEFTRLSIGPKGIPNQQASVHVNRAAVIADAAKNLVFDHCRIAHTGAHGVWMRGGTTHSSIVHTLIEDLGAGGVYLGDPRADFAHPERNCAFLTLHDSIVRRGGRILNGAVGVWLGNVADCAVTHNDISDFLYTGVSMGWTWGYAKTVTRRNHVDFNHIHHIQQGRLSDGGAFYSLGNQEGSTVCNNWIHDVNGYLDNGSPAWGLYTDEGSAHILLASNLIERCRSGAIHQHYGTENTYANNICATFDEFGVWRSRTENHITIRVMNNIFWWHNPSAGTYTSGQKDGPAKDFPADGNVYWCTAGAPTNTAYNTSSWEAWRAAGKDVNGCIADPLFVDPEHGDWTLRADSPALKAGFKPFDWRQAGVLADDDAWLAKAAERTWDEFKDAAKAPSFVRERVTADFELLRPGVLRNAMGSLAPLYAMPGMPGGIEIVTDAAQGKRALKFCEVPNLKRAFHPMVDFKCGVVEGEARLRFAIKGDARCNVSIEGRDYHNGPFKTGPVMRLVGEDFFAAGKLVTKVPVGTWADVDMTLVLSGERKGEWSCTVTPRGGATNTVHIDRVRDAKFSRLTWVGFISYGPEGSTWTLDDIRLNRAAN